MTDAQAKLAAARAALDDAASRGFPDKNQPSLTAIWRAAEAELNAVSDEPTADGADTTPPDMSPAEGQS